MTEIKTKIKICGITRLEDALLAEDLGADYIGFVFTRHSKRQVMPKQARLIIQHLTRAKPIGVFVEQDLAETRKIAEHTGLLGIQHHVYFKEGFAPYFYIHAQSFEGAQSIENLGQYKKADAFLIDSAIKGIYGGTGKNFNWDVLPHSQIDKIIIAGGIGPGNVAKALHYKPFGIDLSSHVESTQGIKDPALLKQLFKEIHNAKNV